MPLPEKTLNPKQKPQLWTATASAKLNMALHILDRQPDGYHQLQSLVVFVDAADNLQAKPSAHTQLKIIGPFAGQLDGNDLRDNLVLRAVEKLTEYSRTVGQPTDLLDLLLEKNLPVAAGLGGGSADAATALKLLNSVWSLKLPPQALAEIGLKLGADVPVSLIGRPSLVEGIGADITPLSAMPSIPVLLVNPLKQLNTAAVYQSLEMVQNEPLPGLNNLTECNSIDDWLDYLSTCRNDLTNAAVGLMPEIGRLLDELQMLPRVSLARMSGSGATCFAAFEHKDDALEAEALMQHRHPNYWVLASATQPVS